MDEVDKIIIECVDAALSKLSSDQKTQIYSMFEQTYGLKSEDIPQNYDEFYDTMANVLPNKQHFAVIREIIRILHQRSRKGQYRESNAIEAFNRLISVNVKKTQNRIELARSLFSSGQTESLLKVLIEKDERVRRLERLAAIGQTAGMVGHDIRNPLQAIIGDVYLAKQDISSLPEGSTKESLEESLESIHKNAQYINKIVFDLQDFARPLVPHFNEVDLEPLIRSILEKASRENIQIAINIDNEAKKIVVDCDFISRILDNLVTNSIQAMPKGGKLTISACKNSDLTIITIEDTGNGIPQETQEKIFTPLFTTKSKGQGFGLAVVKRMTEALHGNISFETEAGKGTKFVVCLPNVSPQDKF